MFQQVYDLQHAMTTTSVIELNKYLLRGAERGDLELVRYCLDAGADPSARMRFGRNALHIAAERGDIKMGQLLIYALGKNINMGTYHSYTPLHLACNSHQHDFLEFLLKKGALVDVADKLGRTTLHYAVGTKNLRTAKLCLQYGANANAMDHLQNTPLSLAAVDQRCPPLVSLLLNSKASPNLQRKLCIPIFLDCVLNIREQEDNSDTYNILSLLLKYGVSPNVVDNTTKKNALHYAAMSGNIELGIFLVEQGTAPFAEDIMGRTSLDIARQFNHYNMVLWLEHLLRKRDFISEISFTSNDMYF